MEELYKTSLWQQFGAAIDMLDNALRDCPEEHWQSSLWPPPEDAPGLSDFWYLGYHTLFWLDCNLHGSEEGFAPPPPYTLSEFDPAGLMPDRVYTKAEMRDYLQFCRQKCQNAILALNDESASRITHFGTRQMPYYELLLYSMRHVQDHTAQLNLFLGQQNIPVISWVSKAKA